MQGEHSDAREARDVPSLLSPPPAAVTEGLSIVRLFCRSSLFLHAHNPSDLASLAHLPLHRGGYKVCLHIEKGRSEERPFSMLDMRLTYEAGHREEEPSQCSLIILKKFRSRYKSRSLGNEDTISKRMIKKEKKEWQRQSLKERNRM